MGYLNALYVSAYQNHVILPIAALRHLELWTAYYCRWNPTFKAQEPVDQRHKDLLLVRDMMAKKVKELELQLANKKLLPANSSSDILLLRRTHASDRVWQPGLGS